MKYYENWTDERLEEEKEELRIQEYDKAPNLSDSPHDLLRSMEKHAEWKAVCRLLQSRQNRET